MLNCKSNIYDANPKSSKSAAENTHPVLYKKHFAYNEPKTAIICETGGIICEMLYRRENC